MKMFKLEKIYRLQKKSNKRLPFDTIKRYRKPIKKYIKSFFFTYISFHSIMSKHLVEIKNFLIYYIRRIKIKFFREVVKG